MRYVAVAVLSLAMISCGNDDASVQVSGEDLKAARSTLTRYLAAVVERDGTLMCRELSAAMAETYESAGQPCGKSATGTARAYERPCRIKSVEGKAPGIRGVVFCGSQGAEVLLVEEDGRWVLDYDLQCVTPDCHREADT